MEKPKHFVLIFILFCASVKAQSNFKNDIYDAFVKNNMTKWKTVIDNMSVNKSRPNDFILELINYQYGYIAWCIGNNKYDLAETYLELARQNVALLEKEKYKISYLNSYKSAFYGFEIGMAWYKAPFLGGKSVSLSEVAIKLDKNNPFAYIQYANALFYMPETFGGSKIVALEYYHKALEIMEKDDTFTKKNWNYLSLLTTIAQAYTTKKKYSEAKQVYEKIIEIESNYTWVKNELYPELLKKL